MHESKPSRGVRAFSRRPLCAATLVGLAGLATPATVWAVEAPGEGAIVTAAADAAGPRILSGVDVVAHRREQNVKATAEPLNTPQTVTVVPKGVIVAQNLLSLRDVLSTVPGITFGAGEGGGGFGDSLNLRGYTASNDITIDGVRDSAQYSRSDTFNLEQIEVTNGANSVYNGAGAVGGTINLVSKRPGPRDRTTLTAGVGTDRYWRGAVDANRRLNESIALRLNAMIHRNDAPGRDVERFKRWGVAPSVTVGMHSDTRFTASYLHQQDRNTPQYGAPFYNGRPLPGVDPSNYYGYSNLDVQKQNIDIVTGLIEHDFKGDLDGLKLRNLTRYQVVDQFILVDPPQGVFCLTNGLKPVAWSQSTTAVNISGFAPCTASDPAPGFYAPSGPRGNYRDTRNTLIYNQTDFSWTGELAGMRHSAVLGFSVMSETFRLNNGGTLRTPQGVRPALPPMNIANPDTVYTGPFNVIPGGGELTSATATPPNASPPGAQDGDRQNLAVYFFDDVSLSDRWSVNFGVRYEHNEGKNSTAFYTAANYLPNPLGGQAPGAPQAGAQGGLPSGASKIFRNSDNLFSYRVGLVFKPTPESSLYAAYGTSKTPSQATVNGSGACTDATCTVDPETARNIEVGAKWDVGGRLSLTAAAFENKRSNYRVASADTFLLPVQQLDGTSRVRGLALSASGALTDRWAVFANYTYLKTKVLQGVPDLDRARGLDFTAGDPLIGVPDHAFSLFTTYDLPHQVQIGYGVTYQGEYYLSQHGLVTGSTNTRTTIPLVKAKAYAVHRATVAWSPTEQLELRLNVTNLFDKVYYTRARTNLAGWATPGDGRNATLTLNYRF